jgi:hypothetical protein
MSEDKEKPQPKQADYKDVRQAVIPSKKKRLRKALSK